MNIRVGTCSWNYDSWVGMVYPNKENTAADYLRHYARKYRTVEIDSWFYRIPRPVDVLSYLDQVDDEFRFTCKVTNSITLTHFRGKNGKPNPDFLSVQLFESYLRAIEPMLPRIDGIMLEFEYLNKAKMPGLESFLNHMEQFLKRIPLGLPMAIEVRNKNYLTDQYFDLLKAFHLQHVFSEKLYMPHVFQVYSRFKDKLTSSAVVRLLGGDRKEIEDITGKNWSQIVLPKPYNVHVVSMLKEMMNNGMKITVNVNNHYEGSAPLTIERLNKELEGSIDDER